MATAEAPERLRIGHYDVELLAESGMSSVYVGRDRDNGREVILKTVPTADFERSSALVREREMLLRLDHPGIVRCFELFAEGDSTVLVLEKVPGQDLGQVLSLGDDRPDEARVREWGIQIASAMEHLHSQRPPIIYRDLKPSNIILRPDGTVVLVDFGATRVRTETPRDTTQLGTPGYAAPEQYGASATDERTDVYALGVTLFELLSRRNPASFGFTFPPLAELGVQVSPAFQAVISRALSMNINERFPSMHAMREALEACRPGASRGRLAGVWPMAVVAGAAAAASLGAQTWPQRYAAGLAVFGCAAIGGYQLAQRSLSPADHDVAPWRRRLPVALLVLLAAGLGAAPLAFPVGMVSAHLRRLSLDVSNVPVPLQGNAAILLLFSVVVGLLGYLSGRALVKRGAWIWPALLFAFTASLFTAHVVAETRRDAGGGPIATEVLWTRDLGPMNVTFDDMTLVPGSGDGKFYAVVRSGLRGFQVIDPADGRTLWSGESSPQQPLNGEAGMLFTMNGHTLSGRAIETGEVRFTYEAPADVGNTFRFQDVMVVCVENGTIAALDRQRLSGQVKPRWTFTRPNAKFFLMPMAMDDIVTVDRESSTAYLLKIRDGSLVWERKMASHGGTMTRMLQGYWVFVNATDVECVDRNTGSSLFRFSLPSAKAGPDQFEPIRIATVDSEHILLQRGNGLWNLEFPSGRVVWSTEAPGERLALHEQGPGVVYLETSSGKLMGLQAATGRITWEWWPGGLLAHAFPPELAHLSMMIRMPLPMLQARPGEPLCLFDIGYGRIGWRHEMPAGFRIKRLVDDGRSLLLLGRDPQEHCILLAVPRPAEMQPMNFGSPQ